MLYTSIILPESGKGVAEKFVTIETNSQDRALRSREALRSEPPSRHSDTLSYKTIVNLFDR